jgi:hypothetical protein
MVLRVGRGHNMEKPYIEKKIFSRTSRPISVKLGTNHPWLKGVKEGSNEGPSPL